MDNGKGDLARQMLWLQPDVTAALWVNWSLWSMQVMHEVNLAFFTFAAGACAGGLKAARTCYESISEPTR